MPRHHHLALALALLTTTLVGCTATPPAKSTAPTAASTPTATPSPTAAIPTPAAVTPATTAADAVLDANASLIGYYTASFRNGHAGGTRPDLVTPWVTGAALDNERALATYLQQKHYRLDGAPTRWNLNLSRSAVTRTKAADGTVNPFGSVHLVGCIESTNHPVGDGAPDWTTKGRHTSIQWTVLYIQPQRRWLVAASTSPSTLLSAASCG